MRNLPRLALLAGLTMLPLMAQPFEAAIDVGQALQQNALLGTDSSGSTYSLKNGFRFGFRITLNSMNHFGHEFGYAYNRAQLSYSSSGFASETGMAVHQGGYNFLAYATKEGSKIRPFATGGVHFNNYVPPGASASYGQGQTKFGFNYGGGVKFRLTDLFMLRFDVRQYQNGKPFDLGGSGMIRMTEVSAGFGIAL